MTKVIQRLRFCSFCDKMAWRVSCVGLIAIVSVVCAIRYEELPKLNRRTVNNIMGRYLNFPGLSFEPNLPGRSTLVRYNKARPSTYDKYVDILKEKTREYNVRHEDIIDCSYNRGYRDPDTWNKACRIDLIDAGPDCVVQQSFGYEDGQPCIMLTLDRISNWVPEVYTNDTVPVSIRNQWDPNYITVTCEGNDPASTDNIGDMTFYPAHGFPVKYYPNTNQHGWTSPFVFVRFENIEPAVLVNVSCTAWAKNIHHSAVLSTGQTTFQVLVN